MNEVTKLYENAEVLMQDCLRKYYCVFDKSNKNCIVSEKCKTKDCVYLDNNSFTSEKQIAILKFCLKWGQVHILQGIDDEYRIENSCYRQGYQPTIAGAIANYINEKWEKLTPEERKQIKEILE